VDPQPDASSVAAAPVREGAGAVEPAAYTPADLTVSAAAADLVRRGVAANTTRAYTRQWARFTAWCAHGPGGDAAQGWAVRTALPATGQTLLEYVAGLVRAGASPASIEQAVAAIRTHHRVAGFKDSPDTEAARLALRGYRKDRAKQGLRPRKSPPITIDELRRMVEVCDPATLAGKRDRVMLVLGYALYARRCELSDLRIEDVEHSDQGLKVLIRASKTDRDAVGEYVPVKAGQHPDTDTVALLEQWLGALAALGVTSGYLLRAVTRHGALFPHGFMTGEAINERIRVIGLRAGLRDAHRLTAHGLRSGPASTAAKRGAPLSAIAEQGRWSPNSPVIYGYIREADRWNQYPDIGL
jgi:integrase